MNTATYEYSNGIFWKQLYRAAILESNHKRIPERVAEAEEAIIARARELFRTAGDDRDEKEALDGAMYALHALEGSWRHRIREN